MNGKILLFQKNIYIDNQLIKSLDSLKSKVQKIALLVGVISMSTFSFSQTTGPAGINSGIRLWLDASDLDGDGIIEGMSESGVSVLDSTVTEWRDKSGALSAPTHFTLPTPSILFSDTPRYSPLEPNFGGHTVVDFNSNSGLIHDLASAWNGAHTVFIVFKQKTALVPIGTGLFSSGIGDPTMASFDEHFQISSDSAAMGTQFAYYTSSNTPAAPDGTENIIGLQSAAQNVIFYTVRRQVGANQVSTYVNGVSPPNTLTTFPTDGMYFDEYFLNGNRDTTLLNDCYIAEVIVYDQAITGAPLRRIHDYLNCKYISSFEGPGPGGVDPCNVALWLKADGAASTNLTGSDVDDWNDLSSNGYNASETLGNRPTYITDDNNFNPSLNFNDGNNQRLFINNSPVSGSFDGLTMGGNPFSFYSVTKVIPNQNGTLFSDNLCTETSGYRVFYTQSSGEWNFNGTSRDGSFVETSATALTTDTAEAAYSLVSFKREGTNNTLQTQDGDIATVSTSPVLSLTPATGSNSPTERWVGKRSNSGSCSNDHFDGNISEIIIVRSSVTPLEDKKIQSYLGLKYGLTIPSTLGNYKSGNGISNVWTFASHWFDVAGLGEDTLSTLDQRISKSQNPSAIVTMSTDSDFTSDNSTARPPLGHGKYLVWGNNNISAASAWTLTGAANDYAILPINWRVKKSTGTPSVYVQVDVNDTDNNIPSFVGDLYLVRGPSNTSMATPVLMTETSTGIWSTTAPINFNDSAYFTFAVKNDLIVEFSKAATSSVNEQTMGTGPNSFPDVLATGIVNVATSINVNAVGGTADNVVGGPDYTYSNMSYAFNTGTYSSSVIPLTPPTLDVSNQDLIDEGFQTAIFQIILGPGVDYGDVNMTGGAVQIHTMSITDDDSYQIEIGNPTNGVENGANVTFEISVVGGGVNTSGANITGTLNYIGGTAVVGTDFQNTGQTTFTIPMGVASATVSLPVDNDMLLEGTETVQANIVTTVGAIASVSSATANITDDELTNLQISIGSAVDGAEGGAAVQFTVSLGAGISNQTGAAITGNVNYGTGVAILGTDFSNSGTFSIANGAGIGIVTATVSPDNLVEPTESVIAIISNPSIGGAGAIHTTFFTDTAYIADEDSANLEISITAPVATVVENLVAGSFNYLIQMDDSKVNGTGGAITGTVTLTGSANPTPPPSGNADYTNPATFSFSIPNGSSSVTVPINVVDDGDIEPPETVIANISGLSHGAPDATNINATVTILDDDAGGIFISIGSPTDTIEGPASPGLPFISFEVFIEGGLLNTTGAPITGNITYSGTAFNGSDYTSVPTFAILPGDNSTTVELEVIDNFVTEPSKYVNAFLAAGPGSPSTGSYANTTTTMNIADDDASSLTISVVAPVDGAEGTTDGSFTVLLDNATFNGTGIPITGIITYGGTADPSNDFNTSPNPLPVSFSIPDGGNMAVINLPVFDDQAVEYTEELIVVISNPSVGSVSAFDSVTVSITDDDAGSLLLSIDTLANPNGTEGGSDLSFIVSMGGGLTNGLGQDLTGTLTYGGTATSSGIDADFVSQTQFAIPDGGSSQQLILGVFQDLFIEQTESVIVSISAPLIGTVGTSDTATALIFDDNNLIELDIAVTSDGVEIPPIPGALDVEFAISISGGLVNQLGTDITGTLTYSGTAMGGGNDYSGPSTFTIPSTSGTTTVTVTVVDDIAIEITETVIATIATTSIGNIGSSGSAEAKIFDDDTDFDNDGLSDLIDPIIGNIDSDCDGIFDGCDADADGDTLNDHGGIDLDNDGIFEAFYYAAPLADSDGDGIHDACDADINGPDLNGDGLSDVHWPTADNDGDLLPDHVDPVDNNIDSDGDGITDGADYNINGIIFNGCDFDGDGIHDVADADDDGLPGVDPGKVDQDGDGIDVHWDMSDSDLDGQQINYIVSPDGDGVNETLIIQGIQVVERHELVIFNRYGEPVYKSEDYNNDWFGQVNQESSIGTEMLGDGVYYYTLDIRSENGVARGYIEIRR